MRGAWWKHLRAEILEGTTADPIALARRIAAEISGLAPHIKISGATDQPMVTVFARSGEAWRSVTVVGFRGGESVPAQTAEPPEAFVAAYRTLAEIRPRDAHPFPKRDFIVTLHEDSVPSRAPSAWPADVPPPPPGLVPDERYVGKPRVYELHGDAGSSLKTFARSIQGYGVRTPAGERVNIGSVHVAIPSVAYLESLYYCRTWKLEPFHVCDRRLPGRP